MTLGIVGGLGGDCLPKPKEAMDLNLFFGETRIY